MRRWVVTKQGYSHGVHVTPNSPIFAEEMLDWNLFPYRLAFVIDAQRSNVRSYSRARVQYGME